MRKFIEWILASILKLAFSLRYRATFKGIENLTPKHLDRPGGILFLPNHPALLTDPAMITLGVFPKFTIRPMIVEYVYFMPGVYTLMKFIKAIPIPNFETSNNSLKRKRHQVVLNEVINGLKKGENFLLYPSGRLKHTGVEIIGGASATHDILEASSEANVVLVRISGLWGSSFSRALTGNVPSLFDCLKAGLWILLKNLIFFAPKRDVLIEYIPAPKDFPRNSSRLEINRWLENWYNQTNQGLTGEPLKLVSYSFWKEELPTISVSKEISQESSFTIRDVSQEVYDKVMAKLVDLTELDLNAIQPQLSLSNNLGLDSLDLSELAVFLQDTFEIPPVPVTELTTVERVLAVAAKKIVIAEQKNETETIDMKKWAFHGQSHVRRHLFEGETIPEVFLNACNAMKDSPAYADMRSGILSYAKVKLAVLVLAEEIKRMDGHYIGILLPASTAAFLCLLACQLAGKVPLMINWTIGAKHLQSVSELSKVRVVLTSWVFLERLDAVDLSHIDDKLVMLETLRRQIPFTRKIQAYLRSKRSTKSILKTFKTNSLSKEDTAVLLFTSGTEHMPKGVPLSHFNILSNQKAALKLVTLYSDDVLLSFLPPFHSFGLCLTGLIGLLAGARTAFFPNPTDGEGLAKAFEHWGATITAGAPLFLKSFLKAAKASELNTMRLCISGAEKTPPELIELMNSLGKKQCLIEGYGITECSPIISGNPPGEPLKGVGLPLEGIDILIIHPETHEKQPLSQEGLILIRGPNVFSGYINPGQASPFITIEGKKWYNSGDIGYLDDSGSLYISGRKKRFVKVGGEMISLLAIETTLLHAAPEKQWDLQSEGTGLAILAKEIPGEKPTFLFIATFDTTPEEINSLLRQKGISNLVRISETIRLDEMPLMGTGKVNYRQLEDSYFETPPNKNP